MYLHFNYDSIMRAKSAWVDACIKPWSQASPDLWHSFCFQSSIHSCHHEQKWGRHV